MPLTPCLTTFEHRVLRVGMEGLSKAAFEAFLGRMPDFERGAPGALEAVHQGLRTGSHCGMLSAGPWSLEILPKTEATDPANSRAILLRMLGVVYDLPAWVDRPVDQALESALLPILIGAFLEEVDALLKSGLLNRYREDHDCLPHLRGKLDVARHLRLSGSGGLSFPCHFDELSIDNPFNQVVRRALTISALATPPASRLRGELHRRLTRFDGVSDVGWTGRTIAALPLDRLSSRYGRALRLAGWIVEALHPDARHGADEGVSFIFDMNRLFEAYIAKMLGRALQASSIRRTATLLSQHGAHYLLKPSAAGLSPALRMKPDLQIVHGTRPLMILDTKWKLTDHKSIDPSDGYQMLAYGHGLGCGRLVLIFPRSSGSSERAEYEYNTVAGKRMRLQLRFVALQEAATACRAIIEEIDEMLTVDTANI